VSYYTLAITTLPPFSRQRVLFESWIVVAAHLQKKDRLPKRGMRILGGQSVCYIQVS
jgi:hypothetical protein